MAASTTPQGWTGSPSPGEKAGRLLVADANAAFDRHTIPSMVASAFAKAQHYQPPLTPRSSALRLARIVRPTASSSAAASESGEPSRFPGEPPLYVGTAAHAADLELLERLGVGAVLNCAAKDAAVLSACAEAAEAYEREGIA